MKNLPLLALLIATAFPLNSYAQGWGSIKGQVVLDGDVPEVKILVMKGDQTIKDAEVCAAQDIVDESVVINPKNKGIANCVIYLSRKPEQIHPEAIKTDQLKFDNKNCQFVPHVLVAQATQKVLAVNSDPVGHNVKTNTIRNRAENSFLGPNDQKGYEFKFKAGEPLPLPVECNIHPWMKAYWFIVDHPYAVVTDKDGKFELKNLPAGELSFRVWQEKVGYIERALTVEVKDGEVTEVPVIKAAPDKF